MTQSISGKITGCIRLPNVTQSKVVISLQTYVEQTPEKFAGAPSSLSAGVTADGVFRLSARPSVVAPGGEVTLIGRYRGSPPPDVNGTADLCWDGCQSGLTEQGVPVRWANKTTFEMRFRAPAAPWFQSARGHLGVHPLVSGIDYLGVECLVVASGCALRPADAEVPVHFEVKAPDNCGARFPCASLTLSATRAQIGDVVSVQGWAPLESIIGQPWGYSLVATGVTQPQPRAAVRFEPTRCACESIGVLAPRYVTLLPGREWSSLGSLHTLADSWAGYAGANPQTQSTGVVWCNGSSIEVQRGPRDVTVSTRGVAAALKGTNLMLLGPDKANPPCATAVVDPSQPDVVYAGFSTGENGVIPPVDTAGLYSRDGGVHWQMVPVPKGQLAADFGGFRIVRRTVEALFGAQSYAATANDVAVEETSDGGATWFRSGLSCPSLGPCVTFGPAVQGNCAMNGSPQLLLVGRAPASPPPSWSTTSWVTSVNGCFSQQLVATSPRGAVLVDPSSPYPLLVTSNGGATWWHVSIPALPGVSSGSPAPLFSQLILAGDGSLLALVPNSSDEAQRLFRLYPRASSWCHVRTYSGKPFATTYVEPMRISGDQLIWIQNPSSRPSQVRDERVRLSKLACAT
ncbi:MAG: hypothetical protein ACHQFZ_06595 [Acidimicrobiales bacterium]